MYVGSLFSGIGGIELGFKKAGFETKWFVESDKYAQQILRKNFPETPIYGDITKVDFTTVPKVDILTGGFPCQDISYAGKGDGIKGSRSSLWKYYKKAIGVLRPKYAFIENVPAIINRGLNVVLADLAEVGYDAEWYNLSASAVGAFHKRDRLFVIAYLQEQRKWRLSIQQRNQRKESIDIDGSCKTISDSEGTREMPIQQQGQGNCIVKNGEDVSDTNETGQQREREIQIRQELFCGQEGYWAVEPELGRVAHGVSNRVDRIRCIGNAVVPQVAEVFAQAIKEVIN